MSSHGKQASFVTGEKMKTEVFSRKALTSHRFIGNLILAMDENAKLKGFHKQGKSMKELRPGVEDEIRRDVKDDKCIGDEADNTMIDAVQPNRVTNKEEPGKVDEPEETDGVSGKRKGPWEDEFKVPVKFVGNNVIFAANQLIHVDYTNYIKEEHVPLPYDDPPRPMKLLPPTAPNCHAPFCRLGCICESFAPRKTKGKLHCGLPDCMLECSCVTPPKSPRKLKLFQNQNPIPVFTIELRKRSLQLRSALSGNCKKSCCG